MKRTYVDIIGEYYDKQEDLNLEAYELGLRATNLRKVFSEKRKDEKFKLEF